MAFPTISFVESQPCKMKNGVSQNMHISVQPNAAGKWKLKLYIKTLSCTFQDGTKEMIRQEDPVGDGEVVELSIPITFKTDKKDTLIFTLNAIATNADEVEANDRLLIQLGKAPEISPATPPPDPTPEPDNEMLADASTTDSSEDDTPDSTEGDTSDSPADGASSDTEDATP